MAPLPLPGGARAAGFSRKICVLNFNTNLSLDIVQRSNYSEPAGDGRGADGGQEDDDEGVAPGGRTTKGRARQATISDKRQWEQPAGATKRPKKSTMNIRTAILYKKNFTVLLEESVSAVPLAHPYRP